MPDNERRPGKGAPHEVATVADASTGTTPRRRVRRIDVGAFALAFDTAYTPFDLATCGALLELSDAMSAGAEAARRLAELARHPDSSVKWAEWAEEREADAIHAASVAEEWS